MKTRITPIVSWSIWAGGLSLVMGIVTRHQLLAGFQADDTGMSTVIAAVFVAGLVISFLSALQLHSEWSMLSTLSKSHAIPASKKTSDLAAVFEKLAGHKQKGEVVDINMAIDTYHSKHNSRARSVSIIAALVVSMGLLGTVVGLIMSISGLGGMVENIGLSRATMMEALKTTVAGMGTAFYTTFFGALGGLILRAVAVSQLNSLSELCAEAAEYADEHLSTQVDSKEEALNQKVEQIIESFDGMQKEIESITVRLSDSFETTMRSFGDALAKAGSHAITVTKESIGGMTEQMASVGSEVQTTFGRFNESIEKAGGEVRDSIAVVGKNIEVSGMEIQTAIGAVNSSIEKSGKDLHEAFGGLNETLAVAGGGIADSFVSLNDTVKESSDMISGSLADFKLSIDGTTIELREAVTELHTAIGEASGEMKTLSKARLDADASEIAGHLSIAASSIQQFLQKKSSSEDSQKVA